MEDFIKFYHAYPQDHTYPVAFPFKISVFIPCLCFQFVFEIILGSNFRQIFFLRGEENFQHRAVAAFQSRRAIFFSNSS